MQAGQARAERQWPASALLQSKSSYHEFLSTLSLAAQGLKAQRLTIQTTVA
jgi:hypothetical protein